MKKIGIFCAALLALGFTACDDTSDLGKMQINEQEGVMEANGVGITYLGGFETGSLNLEGNEGKEIGLLAWTVTDEKYTMSEDQHPFFRLRVASDDSFSDQLTIDLADSETNPNEVLVSADALSDAVITLYGRQPVSRKLWIAVESYVVSGSQLLVTNNALGKKEISVTPMLDPAYASVEPVYYIMTSLNGMTIGNAVKMDHSALHQYDDPVFSYVFDLTEDDLTAGNFQWKIVPESAFNSGDVNACYGVAADTEADVLTGELVLNGKAGELTAASKYLLTINALENTYNISYAADELYVWTPKNAFTRACLLTTQDNVNFSGAAVILGNWKLTAQKDFKGLQFGNGKDIEAGHLMAGSKSTPVVTETQGLKWFDVNLATLTYKIQDIETLGLVGTMTAWGNVEDGGQPDIEMTPSADFFTWTANDVVFNEDGMFKIRSNGNWDGFNLGGDVDNLNYGGDNINIEAGKYDMVLTIGLDHVYSLTITKK